MRRAESVVRELFHVEQFIALQEADSARFILRHLRGVTRFLAEVTKIVLLPVLCARDWAKSSSVHTSANQLLMHGAAARNAKIPARSDLLPSF